MVYASNWQATRWGGGGGGYFSDLVSSNLAIGSIKYKDADESLLVAEG